MIMVEAVDVSFGRRFLLYPLDWEVESNNPDSFLVRMGEVDTEDPDIQRDLENNRLTYW